MQMSSDALDFEHMRAIRTLNRAWKDHARIRDDGRFNDGPPSFSYALEVLLEHYLFRHSLS